LFYFTDYIQVQHFYKNNIIIKFRKVISYILLLIIWSKNAVWGIHLTILTLYNRKLSTQVNQLQLAETIIDQTLLTRLNSRELRQKWRDRKLWSTDTPRIRRVPMSDTCRVRQDTDTCNYTEICDFFKLLAASACQCRVVSIFVLRR